MPWPQESLYWKTGIRTSGNSDIVNHAGFILNADHNKVKNVNVKYTKEQRKGNTLLITRIGELGHNMLDQLIAS